MEIKEKVFTPSEEDIATYWDRGYWISPKLICDEQIVKLGKVVLRIIDGDGCYYFNELTTI